MIATHANSDGSQVPDILGEVDQLRETKPLYDIHEIRELSWIGIANREIDLLAELNDRVTSRISVGYRVHFDRYDEATITQILERRARTGLGPGAVDERLETSDAERRRILRTLQGSYQLIESEGSARWRTYRPVADVGVEQFTEDASSPSP